MNQLLHVTRRGFMNALSTGWALFGAACAAGGALFGRFLMPNVLFEPPQSFKAGFPADYEIGLSEKWKDAYGVWLGRTADGFFALSTVCTHLGCTPNYLKAEQKIKCPCHGSGFKADGVNDGINFEGPAPRPLERYRIVLAEDGQILIDKTRKFQQELGQWDSPEAFLKI